MDITRVPCLFPGAKILQFYVILPMWFIQGASCLTAGHECPKEIVKIAK